MQQAHSLILINCIVKELATIVQCIEVYFKIGHGKAQANNSIFDIKSIYNEGDLIMLNINELLGYSRQSSKTLLKNTQCARHHL